MHSYIVHVETILCSCSYLILMHFFVFVLHRPNGERSANCTFCSAISGATFLRWKRSVPYPLRPHDFVCWITLLLGLPCALFSIFPLVQDAHSQLFS